MIVDRRLVVAVALVVAVVALGLVAVTGAPRAGRPPTGAASTIGDPPAQRSEVVPAPSTPPGPPTTSSTPLTADTVPTPTSIVAATLPADAAVADLVEARRSAPDPAVVYVDDGDAHEHTTAPQDAAGEVAAQVAVAIWSWRFDDPPDRLARALDGLASADVIAATSPSSGELDRRRAIGEVAWGLATPGPPAPLDPAGLVVVVAVAQHTTTSTSAEVVVPRVATLRLRHNGDGWRVVEVVVAP